MASNWIISDYQGIDGALFYPESPAVYVVFIDGALAYVGSTENLSRRIDSHGFNYARYSNGCITPWGRARRLIIKFRLSKKYGDWLMCEARLIRRLQPPRNRRGVREDRRACA